MSNVITKNCPWVELDVLALKLSNSLGEDGFTWLDGDSSELGRTSILAAQPVEQICCRGTPVENNSSNPFKKLRNLVPGYWIGWLSYEAAAWIEEQNPWREDDLATLWIARYDPIIKCDLKNKELNIEGTNIKKIDEYFKLINSIGTQEEKETLLKTHQKNSSNRKIPIESWEWSLNKLEFESRVMTLKNYINRGDIFQANLTTGCFSELEQDISPISLYLDLRKNCPAPFSGVVIAAGQAKGESIISTSPERFLKVNKEGLVETRPIKGTRPRKENKSEDADIAVDLITSSKDRAENIMVVDILRNDLGKVCIPGSIKTPRILSLESYPHVHHLTSVINGHLYPNKTWVNLLEACWPGGSITGAPKLRACKRLYELESLPRGPYCGALIKIDWDENFDSCILIRTLIKKDLVLRVNAGCGIVADSNPQQEAEEMSWKLVPILNSLNKK